MNRSVTYDAASRILGYSHAGASSFDQSYGYDDLDRLNTMNLLGVTAGYQYDANGNRTQFSIGSTFFNNTIASDSNKLNASDGLNGPKTLAHDAAGNQVNGKRPSAPPRIS